VDITPLGGGAYACVVRLARDAPGALLRVAFKLDGGLRMSVVAEPARP
jgi:hypothetical protein